MAKKEKTGEEIYKSNIRKVKFLKALAPIVFWGCLALSVLCFVLAIKGTFGNLNELLTLLDDDVYTGEQLQANYAYLINKYGEWVIGSGGAGFTIRFIDIKRVAFSGFALTNFVLFVAFLLIAFIMGKWVLPKIANQIEQDNQDMVNLTVLRTNKE